MGGIIRCGDKHTMQILRITAVTVCRSSPVTQWLIHCQSLTDVSICIQQVGIHPFNIQYDFFFFLDVLVFNNHKKAQVVIKIFFFLLVNCSLFLASVSRSDSVYLVFHSDHIFVVLSFVLFMTRQEKMKHFLEQC